MSNFDTFFSDESCNIKNFEEIIKQKIDANLLSHFSEIKNNIPIYNMKNLKENLHDKNKRLSLLSEWAYIFSQSSGVLVLENTYDDCSSID